ncbi:MAG: FMN-binding protein [Planctomycetota bacterium]
MTDINTTDAKSGKIWRKAFLYGTVLMGVCIASGAGVSVLYVTNKDRIADNKLKSFRHSLKTVTGRTTDVRPLDENAAMGEAEVYYAPKDTGVRYVARGSARGYQSTIDVLVSIDAQSAQTPLPADPVIHRVAVVSSQETPGLGENINKIKTDISLWGAILGQGEDDGASRPWFQEQFHEKRLSDLKVETTEGENIQAITGATITSRGTTQAVRNAVQTLIDTTQNLYGTEQSTAREPHGATPSGD